MIPLLLATLLAVQDPAAPQAEWRELDGIVKIINEETVTRRGFQKQLQAYLREKPGDRERASRALSEELVRNAVGSQAGEALGIDANLVKRSVRDWERHLIQLKGGVDLYAASLAQDGLTAEEMRADIEKQVLRRIWEAACTGKGPNRQQKIIADRFVRPGTLRLSYEQLAGDPRLVARIGGSSSKVVLQILEVDPVKVGGTAQAERAAARIRASIASGESDFERESGFALAGTKYESREPVDEGGLAEVDPPLAQLVLNAREGELLPPIKPRDKTPQWRIVKLVQRIPAVVPAFVAPGVQKTIRELHEDWLDNRRLALARQQQYDGSYIWPPLEGAR
jgi:hypothetical protein